MRITLAQIQTFLDIIDAGSVQRAADNKGVSQSAVSNHMRDLQGRLKVRLFYRVGNDQRLTAAGCEFLKFARQIERNVSQAAEAMLLFRSNEQA